MALSVQYDSFQEDAFETFNGVELSIIEGYDIASFTAGIYGALSFSVTEGADVASFTTTATTLVSFDLPEGADVASINVAAYTQATFTLFEGLETASFGVLTGAILSFNLTEGAEIVKFRGIATYWTLEDADYIVVPQELQLARAPFDDRVITVNPAGGTSHINDEWQRIDVDQTRGRRAP